MGVPIPEAYQYDRPVPRGQTGVNSYRVAEAPQESLAGAQALINVGQQLQSTANEADKWGERMDTTAAQEALNKLREKRSELTVGEDGFVKYKAGDVINKKDSAGRSMFETYPERINAAQEEISGSLSSARAKAMFRAAAVREVAGFKTDVAKHGLTQSEKYEEATFKNTATLISNQGIANSDDPAAVEATGEKLYAMTLERMKGQGLPGEAQAEAVRSDFYKLVISRKIVTGDTSAVPLFEKYKDKLDAKDRVGMEGSIKEMSLGVQAQESFQGLGRGSGPTSEQAKAGVKVSMAHWTGDGYSKPVAAGITAGFLRESQFSPGATNKGDGRDGSDSINIGQWNSARAQALKAFAASRGLNPNDVSTGLAYAKAEIDGVIPYSVSGLSPEFKEKLQNAKSEKEAADLMTRGYFRPLHTEGESKVRQQSASAILAQHGGEVEQGSTGSAVPTVTTVTTSTGDVLTAAVNAATGTRQVVVSNPEVKDEDGLVNKRDMKIQAQQLYIQKLDANIRENGNNPALFAKVKGLIEAEYTRNKAAVQLYADQTWNAVQEYVSKGGPGGTPATTMPRPDILARLTPEQQTSVEKLITHNIEGKKVKTNLEVYGRIHANLTSSDANVRKAWVNVPIYQFAEFLSPEDVKHFMAMQGTARADEDKYLTDVMTPLASLHALTDQMGIKRGANATADDIKKLAAVTRSFQNELTALETEKGKKADQRDIQNINDGLAKKLALGKTWYGGTSESPPVALMEFKDVPAEAREQAISAIRRNGGVPTEERILEVYRHVLVSEPRQTEIPRPLEPPMLGLPSGGGGRAPVVLPDESRSVTFPVAPRSRATPRVIDNPTEPEPNGGMSTPVGVSALTRGDDTLRALRLRLGLN